MLVLSRRQGEKIVIGDDTFIEVLSVSGEGVRIGIIAPRETSIFRYEVFEEIETANRAAEIVLSEIGQNPLNTLKDLIHIEHYNETF